MAVERVIYGSVYFNGNIIPPVLSGQLIKLTDNNTFSRITSSSDKPIGISLFDYFDSNNPQTQVMLGPAMVYCDSQTVGTSVVAMDFVALDPDNLKYRKAQPGDWVFGECISKFTGSPEIITSYMIRIYDQPAIYQVPPN